MYYADVEQRIDMLRMLEESHSSGNSGRDNIPLVDISIPSELPDLFRVRILRQSPMNNDVERAWCMRASIFSCVFHALHDIQQTIARV